MQSLSHAKRWVRQRVKEEGIKVESILGSPASIQFGEERVCLVPEMAPKPEGAMQHLVNQHGAHILWRFLGESQKHYLEAFGDENLAYDWIRARFNIVSGVGESPRLALVPHERFQSEVSDPVRWDFSLSSRDNLELLPTGNLDTKVLLANFLKLPGRLFSEGTQLQLVEMQPTMVLEACHSDNASFWAIPNNMRLRMCFGTTDDTVVLNFTHLRFWRAVVSLTALNIDPSENHCGKIWCALREGPKAWIDGGSIGFLRLRREESVEFRFMAPLKDLDGTVPNNILSVMVHRTSNDTVIFEEPDKVKCCYRYDSVLERFVEI